MRFACIDVYRKIKSIACYLLDCIWLVGVRVRVTRMGKNCRVNGIPIITNNGGSIVLGNHVVLCSRSYDTALGVAHPIVLRTLTPGSRIYIGNNAGLSGVTICASVSIEIGDECLFGADVMIVDTDFHPLFPLNRRYEKKGILSAPVSIGSNVFLGARTMVLKGVTIGNNTVVGAGSVVTKSIPANVIAAGNPARVIGILPDK